MRGEYMGLRSRVGNTLVKVGKAFGSEQNEPPGMAQAARDVSQMDMSHPFAPGEPVGPYDGYSRHTRQFNFETGYNISTRPRSHERVSFDTLRGLVESYDVAQICIHHRIDSLRSLDWNLTAADWYTGDVTDAVAAGMKALRRPDGINSFETWFAKWMYDVLAYDAGALYRLRNRAGKVVGLQPVDGTTIAPLLDYWGNPPQEPAEAYVQYVNGLPWNWLTRGDLIYEPFRPRNNSPYGHAPLESIMLSANTDIRFQIYFLQRFTSGNVPEAFAAAPEEWSPDQIEQFQEYWDSFMLGDQSQKHQIKWMPGGSTLAWSNEKDFTDAFSLFLMRKATAAYHVVPTDIGFTENSNYSTGESQADVGHRIGDLPLGRYGERIITSWLQDDLGLPIKHQFDWGEEQDDRVAQANADDVYVKIGVIGASELRQMRFGLDEPEGQPVPRFIYTTRAGPIPLSSLYDVAGPVDTATGAPEPGVPLPHKEFELVEGVVPVPAPKAPALAERLYGPSSVPAAPAPGQVQAPVAKDGEGAAGITSDTGITGYDGPGEDDDEPEAVAKELAAFRRFEKARRKAGAWRDFTFDHVPAGDARRLNETGRDTVAKAEEAVRDELLASIHEAMAGHGSPEDKPAGVVKAGDGREAEGVAKAADATRAPKGRAQSGDGGVVAPIKDGANRLQGNPVTPGKAPLGSPGTTKGADQPDVLGRELPIVGRGNTALSDLVGSVVKVGAEEQVTRPDARRVIAPVQDEKSVRDRLVGQLPGDPVRKQGPTRGLAGHPGGELHPDDPVVPTVGVSGGGPSPAVAAFVNLGPEAPGEVGVDEKHQVSLSKATAGSGRPQVKAPGLPDAIRPAIVRRRERLLSEHLATVGAAWDACIADLSARDLVRDFREDTGLVAKAADPDQQWWKDVAVAAALAWLAGIEQTAGYAALVAAIEDAIRSGMAEGEADALAAAAARQGVTGLDIAAAFADAYSRLAGDPGVSQRAQETIEAIVAGAAADLGRQLADDAGDGSGEQDMISAVRGVVTGVVRSVQAWLANNMWAALGAGVTALMSQATPDGGTALVNWENDGNPCAACQDNAAGSPYAPEDIPDFPAHPRCQCDLEPAGDISSSFFSAFLS